MTKSTPENWQTKKLSEVCVTGAGGTPLKSHKDYYKNGNIPWLRSGEVCIKEITESELFITKKGLNNSSAKIFPKNTVLIAMYGATAGQTGILRFEASINQAICGILPNEDMSPEFLYYFFLSEKDKLVRKATGNAQPNISQIKIKDTMIPLPPLPEQKRIVKILDEVFRNLEVAKKNAEKSLVNAKDIFESYLQEAFEKGGDDWEERLLEEIVDFKGGGTPSKKNEKYWEGNIPWVSPKDMKAKYITDTIDHITEDAIKNSSTTVIPKKSILIVVRSGILSRTIPLAIAVQNLTMNQDMKALIPKNTINSDFLYFALLAARRKLLSVINKGATVHRLQSTYLKSLKILLPPLSTQSKIIKKLNALSEKTKKLEDLYQQKIDNLEELKKSILQKTFVGEL